MMSGYLMIMSPVYDIYGVDEINHIVQFQTYIGVCMIAFSVLGCSCIGIRRTGAIRLVG